MLSRKKEKPPSALGVLLPPMPATGEIKVFEQLFKQSPCSVVTLGPFPHATMIYRAPVQPQKLD